MSEHKRLSMSTLDSIMKEVYGPTLVQQQKLAKEIQEEQQAKWNALPKRIKLYRKTKGWVYWKRRSLGELIAGEKFDG